MFRIVKCIEHIIVKKKKLGQGVDFPFNIFAKALCHLLCLCLHSEPTFDIILPAQYPCVEIKNVTIACWQRKGGRKKKKFSQMESTLLCQLFHGIGVIFLWPGESWKRFRLHTVLPRSFSRQPIAWQTRRGTNIHQWYSRIRSWLTCQQYSQRDDLERTLTLLGHQR